MRYPSEQTICRLPSLECSTGSMSEEQTVPVRRRRRSRAEAEQLVAEFESSGLSRAQFCQSRGLALHTLDRYRYRLRESKQDEGRWIAVELGDRSPAAAGSGLAVMLTCGRRIEIARGFDPATLQQLLAALEQA